MEFYAFSKSPHMEGNHSFTNPHKKMKKSLLIWIKHVEHCCPIELAVMMEKFYFTLSNMVATSHMHLRALETD